MRRFMRQQGGVTAVETALIFPVLLFGLMMLFELARIALLIGVGSLALEHALQDFRHDNYFYERGDAELRQSVADRMIHHGYGFIDSDDINVDIMTFDSLRQFGGSEEESDEDEDDDGEGYKRDASTPPIITVTVDLHENFMTPLPALFGLGDTFQYQYRQLLGSLISENPDDDEK